MVVLGGEAVSDELRTSVRGTWFRVQVRSLREQGLGCGVEVEISDFIQGSGFRSSDQHLW